jgi:hypothetical protein
MSAPAEQRFAPIAKTLVKAQLFFALFTATQFALITVGAFGAVPVIPVAFFTCANLLCLVVTAPIFLFAAVLMTRKAGRTWATLATLLLPVISVALVWQVWKVCF